MDDVPKICVTTYVEKPQHEALRFLAYQERASIADLVREAIECLIASRRAGGKLKDPETLRDASSADTASAKGR